MYINKKPLNDLNIYDQRKSEYHTHIYMCDAFIFIFAVLFDGSIICTYLHICLFVRFLSAAIVCARTITRCMYIASYVYITCSNEFFCSYILGMHVAKLITDPIFLQH